MTKCCFSSSSSTSVSGGQVLASATNVTIRCVTSASGTNGVLLYNYTITEPGDNSGTIWMLVVDLSRGVGSQTLSSSDLPSFANFLPAPGNLTASVPASAQGHPAGSLVYSSDGALQ